MEKRTYILLLILSLSLAYQMKSSSVNAQSPEMFSYQALVRNASNVVLVNQAVGMRISILQGSAGGTSVYTETQTSATNAGGIVSLQIGAGTVVSGNFSAIDWSNGPYYIKTETDPAGGSSYSISGTLQMISVPYAMYSKSANYNDLENKPALDGSETRVTAGTSIAVTGGGTIGSPYMINFSTQSLSYDQLIAIVSPYAGQIAWCNNCGSTGELQVYNGTIWTNWCGGEAAAALPTIVTTEASSIGAYSATSGGNITSDGGDAITSRGICWSTSSNPTVSDPKTNDGSGSGSYSSSITGLLPLTTYYARAYAVNIAGTGYGNQISFTTPSTVPTLTTTVASPVTSSTASSGGNITSDGGASVTARGVCWRTSPNPTIANSKTSDGTGTGSFTSTLGGLSSGTTYYVRAYATNDVGTAYGNEVSFYMPTLPTVTTTTPSVLLPSTSANSGGDVTSDGGGTVTIRGVVWSTVTDPLITDPSDSKTNDGTGTGLYSSSMTGLTLGTVYYVKAYATNSAGTAYGAEKSFIALRIGDSYGGGKVFFIDATQLHGLIAASSDQSTGIRWYNGSDITTNATGSAVGTGNANTNLIVSVQGAGSYAAKLCYDYSIVVGGITYDDWYLPSLSEINLLYWQQAALGGGFGNIYWSSTESGLQRAMSHGFSPVSQTSDLKSSSRYVRAVRSF